jgi:hypothetical protein
VHRKARPEPGLDQKKIAGSKEKLRGRHATLNPENQGVIEALQRNTSQTSYAIAN